MTQFIKTNEVALQLIYRELEAAPVGAVVTIEKSKKYSAKQRGSLHVWCGMLADTLNECGRYRVILSPINRREIECPWSMNTVKEDIYKPVLEALSGKDSTEDQTSAEPSDVALVISKHFADTGIVCPPWPSNRG